MDRSELEEIKERFDLSEVMRRDGILLSPIMDEHVCLCPFHQEDSPSMRVSTRRYHCFGCGEHGDVISWTMHHQQLSFPEALRALGADAPRTRAIIKKSPILSSAYDAEATWRCIQVNEFYMGELISTGDADDVAKAYIKSRIRSAKIKHRFGIGYTLGIDPKSAWIDWSAEELVESGLCIQGRVEGQVWPRLRDRMTIPLTGPSGYVIGYIGRLIPRNDNAELPRYINPPTTPSFHKKRYLYGWQGVTKTIRKCIIVEGVLDALALYRAKEINVLAILGCQLSVEQSRILLHYFDEIEIMLDGDMPGISGALEAMRMIGPRSYITFLPKDADPWNFVEAHPGEEYSKARKNLISMRADIAPRLDIRINLMNYDRTLLDKIFQPYCQDNIDKGWPHLNILQYAIRLYPEYSEEIRRAMRNMLTDVERIESGTMLFKEHRIRALLAAWKKPCKEIRKEYGRETVKRQGQEG